jgi:hypothetical protein
MDTDRKWINIHRISCNYSLLETSQLSEQKNPNAKTGYYLKTQALTFPSTKMQTIDPSKLFDSNNTLYPQINKLAM